MLLFDNIIYHVMYSSSNVIAMFSSNDVKNLVEESLKMSKFDHPNVMKLIGVCIDARETPYIVMPYMIYGSLLSYLKKKRAELSIENEDDQEMVREHKIIWRI